MLGGDKDNTVSGSGSVDGGRGGVLKDRYALDVIGVETAHGTGDAID